MGNKPFNCEMLVLARHLRGISQEEVAIKTKISQGRLSKIENCIGGNPTQLELKMLSKVLNYPAAFFFQQDRIYPLSLYFCA